MDSHPIQGGVAILSVASRYRNRDKLQPCGPPWRERDFILFIRCYMTNHSVAVRPKKAQRPQGVPCSGLSGNALPERGAFLCS